MKIIVSNRKAGLKTRTYEWFEFVDKMAKVFPETDILALKHLLEMGDEVMLTNPLNGLTIHAKKEERVNES